MAQLTLTFVGRVVGEYELDRERLTIGRRPSNDLQIDNLAVSGHHAVVHRTGEGYVLEDVGSTNGTYVNEVLVQRHILHQGDVVRIGKHELIYSASEEKQSDAGNLQKTVSGSALPSDPLSSIMVSLGEHTHGGKVAAPPNNQDHLPPASIRILNGSRKGSELRLDHLRTRLGRPNVPGAVITRTAKGYTVSANEDGGQVLVNDIPAKSDHLLEDRDVIEINGFQVEFYYL